MNVKEKTMKYKETHLTTCREEERRITAKSTNFTNQVTMRNNRQACYRGMASSSYARITQRASSHISIGRGVRNITPVSEKFLLHSYGT